MADDRKKPTIQQFFLDMTDNQKLDFIVQLSSVMAPEFRQVAINELARDQAQAGGEVTLNVSSDDKSVRIDFGKALAWFIMPKEHAMRFGMLLMQHAGATLERREPGSSPDEPPIDIKPM